MRFSKKAKNLNFWSFLSKKAYVGTFFSHLQALTIYKVPEKVMNGFQEKVSRMDAWTEVSPKVSNDRWSREQKMTISYKKCFYSVLCCSKE